LDYIKQHEWFCFFVVISNSPTSNTKCSVPPFTLLIPFSFLFPFPRHVFGAIVVFFFLHLLVIWYVFRFAVVCFFFFLMG